MRSIASILLFVLTPGAALANADSLDACILAWERAFVGEWTETGHFFGGDANTGEWRSKLSVTEVEPGVFENSGNYVGSVDALQAIDLPTDGWRIRYRAAATVTNPAPDYIVDKEVTLYTDTCVQTGDVFIVVQRFVANGRDGLVEHQHRTVTSRTASLHQRAGRPAGSSEPFRPFNSVLATRVR